MTVTIAQRGLFYDELRTDVVYQHSPGRTLDIADNTLFSTLTMNPQSLHLDADASAATEFGQRLVNSMLTLSTLIGLSVGQLTQATTIANLGFGAVRFPHPVFAGDTLYASTSVVHKRLSTSWENAGIVEFEHVGRNQHGETVAIATRTALMRVGPVDVDTAQSAADPAGAT